MAKKIRYTPEQFAEKFPWAAQKILKEWERFQSISEELIKTKKPTPEERKRAAEIKKARVKHMRKVGKSRHPEVKRQPRRRSISVLLNELQTPARLVYVPFIDGEPAVWYYSHFRPHSQASKKHRKTVAADSVQVITQDFEAHRRWEKKFKKEPAELGWLRIHVNVYPRTTAPQRKLWIKKMMKALDKQPADVVLSFPSFVKDLYNLKLYKGGIERLRGFSVRTQPLRKKKEKKDAAE